ncbi:MAG: SPASM domain-containing protein [Candidatus Solibacter usitatus]|nr:SPASM domain-containing protein [Candidatus Solibacter usitatus]
MESIYYVMTWLCHRSCEHCYDDRFRPYHGDGLAGVLDESRGRFRRIIANLPGRMTFRDRGSDVERRGSIILAGGEVLLDQVRESVLYPALELLRARYAEHGGCKLIVQTTGDLLTPRIAAELRELGVWTVSVSGMDDFHAGLEGLRPRVAALLEEAGFTHLAPVAGEAREADDDGRYYHLFGATPDHWIGRLWPRGRAMANELSSAGMEDNFCARWSGGIHFLDSARRGSEVSIEPDGSVYPCCIKTRLPIGNAAGDPLESILVRLRGNPVYEAINAGEPHKMGLSQGWSEETFREKSRLTLPSGRPYQNLCIGCDRFHEEVLIPLAAPASTA